MSDAAKLDRHWHWKDLSAKIATDPLILLSTGIGGRPKFSQLDITVELQEKRYLKEAVEIDFAKGCAVSIADLRHWHGQCSVLGASHKVTLM